MAGRKASEKTAVKSASKASEAAVKVEAPKTASVKAEDKATTPEEAVKAEEKEKTVTARKKAAQEETVKKAPGRKPAAEKEPAKKETTKKEMAKNTEKEEQTGLKTEIHVQFADQSLAQEDLERIAKDIWQYDLNQDVNDLNSLKLYVKPEERRVYYVMNEDQTGSFGI